MLTSDRVVSKLDRLASRLEQDIRQRGLCAGDRYLTAPEVASSLGVSTGTAHRVMQVLAERKMLVRRRNCGTFVGPHFEMKRSTIMRTVYLLMPSTGVERDVFPVESFIYGVRTRLDSNVQVSFLPRGDAEGFVRELLLKAPSLGVVAGFVPVSCPHDIYRRLADSGVPTVISGTPYDDQADIASVDVDNREAGRLLAEYLTAGGHQRMALLSAMEGRPGDNNFYDGVSEALTAARLPHNALIVRIVPTKAAALTAQLSKLLLQPDSPTAVIVRTPAMARLAGMALEELRVPADRCEIVYQRHPTTERAELPFTCVQPRDPSGETVVDFVSKMLNCQERGEPLDVRHVILPVDLCQRKQ